MMTVLIVEDDLFIADLLQQALEAEGFEVCGIARTVAQASNATGQQKPDFAVVDIRLADGDLGTDVAVNLRKTTQAGILFSTGNSSDLSVMRQLGDAVITKPYQMSDIGRALRIIREVAQCGQTSLSFPRNFQLLSGVAA